MGLKAKSGEWGEDPGAGGRKKVKEMENWETQRQAAQRHDTKRGPRPRRSSAVAPASPGRSLHALSLAGEARLEEARRRPPAMNSDSREGGKKTEERRIEETENPRKSPLERGTGTKRIDAK
ncbi:hypothetical protein TGFOU_403890 [Toxoplasma gondii FOU]|uniref:Uncharacterized protein n=1 Tax=Toxoplasma gondii FOU TaxID=943167 RepID=A0A086L978_TOXGO|nr:hypothetical protein TGFOU_403890 [Toxoplasma gondii FOU]